MAGNIIYTPLLSSVRWVRVDAPVNPNYNFVHFDDDWFENTIRDFEDEVSYYQKWQLLDTVKFQVLANYDPIKIELIDCRQRVYKDVDLTPVNTAIVGQPYNVYEGEIQLADVPEGLYYFLMSAGFGENVQYLISEPQDIRAKHDNTMLLEFSNSYNKFGVVWDTGIKMTFRVEAVLKDFQPGSEDTLYIDQTNNVTLLDSKPFRSFKFSMGGELGVPDWVADMVLRMFACSSIMLDGKQFVKDQGAKMEPNRIENYPLRGWSMDVREAKNRDIQMFDDSFDDQFVLVYNIQTDLFGTFNDLTSNNEISIIEND